jgi:hypothetical protein
VSSDSNRAQMNIKRALRTITLQIKRISPREWFQQLILKSNETSYHPYPKTGTSYNFTHIVKVFWLLYIKNYKPCLIKAFEKRLTNKRTSDAYYFLYRCGRTSSTKITIWPNTKRDLLLAVIFNQPQKKAYMLRFWQPNSFEL